MRLSPLWKRVLAALVVLGIMVFFQLKAANRPACTPGSCPLTEFGNSPRAAQGPGGESLSSVTER